MADVTISGLPAVTTVVPGTDVLPLVSDSGATTTKATPDEVVKAVLPAPGPIGADTASSGAFTTLSASSTVSGAGFSTYLASPPAIGSGTANDGTFTSLATTTLSASNTVSGAGFSTYLASPPAIGGTTPAAGSFTQLTTSAGTTTIAPINMTAGTNLTTATAGAVEYDGAVAYLTPTANCRGVVASEQFITLTSAFTLNNATGVQKMFNSSTNGAVTLPVGTFAFECEFNVSTLATTGTFGFALGGGATFTQYWTALAARAALATASAPVTTFNTAANVALTATSATTTGYARITGYIRVTGAGTLIPQFSQTVASAAVVGLGSYFRIKPMGSSTVTTVGNWS